MLARWSGWGALPEVFDDAGTRLRAERDEVRRLLGSDEAWVRARRTTINAHYTSASVVKAMWDTAEGLGFTAGRVLEPGCGSGNFLGFAPGGADLVGVEADPTTAEIARLLYGVRATIHAGRYEELDEPDGGFDLVIGNVPFADVTPHDPRHNRARLSLHNYFLVKSLHLVRPGGLVLALTSRYTLDARNPAARRAMAGLADLVGAVRFPAGAFRAAAGTDVIEDLLVLRRRDDGAEPGGPAWLDTVPIADAGVDYEPAPGGDPVSINRYLVEHPDMVLGRLAVGQGQYRQHELTVEPTGDEPGHVEALIRVVGGARARGAVLRPAEASRARARLHVVHQPESTGVAAGEWDTRFAQEGSFVVSATGTVGRLRNGTVRPHLPGASKGAAELRRLVGLRDAARHVLAVQLADAPDGTITQAQGELAVRYGDYVRLYGPINRYTLSRRTGPNGDTSAVRRRPAMGGFRVEDPDWPLVAALEDFDDESQTARRTAIFTKRVIAPPAERLGVDTAQEAVAVCLDETGRVTHERVAELLGIPERQVDTEWQGLVFEDPSSGRLLPAHVYLSGNVRGKLVLARLAAAEDDRWDGNVAALERVLPRQLELGEVTVRLGAPWVEPFVVERFARDVLRVELRVEHLPELGRWATEVVDVISRVAISSEWGTSRAGAPRLLEDALNQRLTTVTDIDPATDRRVRNDGETLAARAKQEAIGERFSAWVWEHPVLADQVVARFNGLFRSDVLPTYDGSHLALPGLAATFEPRRHQRDAVARIVTDGRALLAHVVGAGKTATMVMAAMELRRLGAVAKPAVVVPNHMLEQFSREWLQLYPTARLLVASKEMLTRERRKEFVARCATGEWDGVVFTQSGFKRLPTTRTTRAAFLDEQLEAARHALTRSKDGKGISVKRLERRIARMEAEHERLLASASKDDGVRWEETGIDYLFIDEAHAYKNRRIDTLIEDISVDGSQQAEDLDVKLWALRRAHGPRVVTFATATPVANSIAELWTMESYLHPDELADRDLAVFDAWAATFARTHSALELAPDGSSYRIKTRLARYQNVPELLGLYRQVADVRTADDLDLPTPEVAGGKAESVVVPASATLEAYMEELGGRAERVHSRAVLPTEDNMPWITTDGRKAALDVRLVGLEPHEGGKVVVAADRIATTWAEHRDDVFRDDSGAESPRRGALQLVFCDVSTPAAAGWNPYDELKRRLTARGVPADEVRFMQDAKTDVAKAALFAACREGSVSVLIGSTQTMGVGTNVQRRAIALHHLDAPWRPADIEQRDGRILRQGNQNQVVEIVRYVTEGSFDVYMWQTLERKAAFISQVTRGDVEERHVDDIGDEALSFAEVKALATGDPRILEKAGVDNEVARLARLERAWQNEQHDLRRTITWANDGRAEAEQAADHLAEALPRLVDTSADRFRMTVAGASYTARTDAGARLQALALDRLAGLGDGALPPAEVVGELAGFRVELSFTSGRDPDVCVLVPEASVRRWWAAESWGTADPHLLVQALERDIRSLPDRLERSHERAVALARQAEDAEALLGRPWEHVDRYAQLRARQQELDEALTVTEAQPPTAGEPTMPAPVAPPSLAR